MNILPWIQNLAIVVTASALMIGCVRWYYHRRDGTPLPPYLGWTMVQMAGFVLFNLRHALPIGTPEIRSTILALVGMSLCIAGSIGGLREMWMNRRQSRESDLPRPNEPERIANR